MDRKPQTRTGQYLAKMADGGHFKQKLGEAALALTECFCKADSANQRSMGTQLLDEMQYVLVEIYGWDKKSSDVAFTTLASSMRSCRDNPKEVC